MVTCDASAVALTARSAPGAVVSFFVVAQDEALKRFVGFLDPLGRTMHYASAGHGPTIFYDRRQNTFTACHRKTPAPS